MIFRIVFIFLLGLSTTLFAQDYYLSTYTHHAAVTNRSFMAQTADGGIIQATQLDTRAILVKRMNQCGTEIWAKEIKHPSRPLSVDDVKLDQQGNFIFSGDLSPVGIAPIEFRAPYICSISSNGTVNFFKKFNFSIPVGAIHYSLAINDKNEYFIYFNHNTSGTGNVARVSIVKIDPTGFPLWVKSYDNIYNWGRAITTRDGGLLFRAGSALTRVDSLGEIVWSKDYVSLSSIEYPVEIDGGFILFRYPTGAVVTTNLIKIDHNGETKWVTNDFDNVSPKRGILRKNGNVLFTGSSNGIVLVEVDTADGTLIQFKKHHPNSNFRLSGVDLFENDSNEVFVSGIDASGILSSNFYMRLNDSLELPNCSSTPLTISNNPGGFSNIGNTGSTVIRRTNRFMSLLDEPIVETTLALTTPFTTCNSGTVIGTLNLGRDTILCPKQNIILGDANSNFDSYLWSTGETSKTINVSSAGDYWLQVGAACDTLRDSILVNYYPDVGLNLGPDLVLCSGDSIELGKGLSFNNYLWSTGEQTLTITIKNEGIYWLEVQTNCGIVRDSIEIENYIAKTPINLGNDTVACPIDSIVLGDSNSTFDTYKWNTGDSTKTISIINSGLYILETSSACESFIDTIGVGIYTIDFTPFVINRKTIRSDQEFTVKDTNNFAHSQRWDFGDSTNGKGRRAKHSYKVPGNYTISMTSLTRDNCPYTISKIITVKPSRFRIPSAFTPNNDGINDRFSPIGNDILSYSIKIYNRWGEMVINTNLAWDGKVKNGVRAKEGIYYYEMDIYFSDGSTKFRKGSLNLFR